ncbi:predicted protein [Sclerotinia sclerotiorum 1980 UF-70]|uniref:Uncharacterized protein n=1 Tax=Sclerotinia sclerotiorum (strain ATCC 18683 / 1980 / Ss-1) TaxID=665079 RepID=A7ECK4_SCLS1|nr:predicted protein [Sclerotinia sclerotiorum 1980 UF-70]EDO00183.1 predicted protein [Sclerotinia sclerotiorum 1980 UF-70]
MPSGRPNGGAERRAPVCGDKMWKCYPPNVDEEEVVTPTFGVCDDIESARPLVTYGF